MRVRKEVLVPLFRVCYFSCGLSTAIKVVLNEKVPFQMEHFKGIKNDKK
jgi:hypothetical protein